MHWYCIPNHLPVITKSVYQMDKLERAYFYFMSVTNEDCMALMARYPDKYFELALVDPPYGIGAAKVGVGNSQKARQKKDIKGGDWDSKVPDDAYFEELFRVSKNQIICGANYFRLPPTRGIICWDKGKCMRGRDFSEWEFLWSSFDRVARLFYFDMLAGQGFIRGNQSRIGQKIHPTQKPIQLYKWLLTNYAKSGDKILDTHLGSGSSRIAAYDLGFDFTACELDADYFAAQEKRFAEHVITHGNMMFKPDNTIVKTSLF